MTAQEALDLITWIPVDKIKSFHTFKIASIQRFAKKGIKPSKSEADLLNEVYRYTNDGGDKQDQPFKQYRRKTSWGVK